MPACCSPTVPTRRLRLLFRVVVAACTLLALLGVAAGAEAQTTYNSSGGISIDPSGTSSTPTYGTSSIVVTDAATVTSASVTINDLNVDESGAWSSFSVASTSFILVYCPTAGTCREYLLLGSTGNAESGASPTDNFGSGINVTVEDSASSLAPGCTTFEPPTCPAWSASPASQTYKPSSFWNNDLAVTPTASDLGLPSPYSGYSLAVPSDDGSTKMNSEFTVQGSGTWTLLIATDSSFGDNTPISISGWSLTLTYAVAPSTTTTVSSNQNPVFTSGANSSVTFTSNTTSSGSPVPDGSVTFQANGSNLACTGGNPAAVSGGSATCTTSFSAQGVDSITAAYASSGDYAPSTSNTVDETVTQHPTQSGNTWCNTGSVSVGELGAPGNLYPSLIDVTGVSQSVGNVQVQLNNVTGFIEGQHLLVAPDGVHNLDFFDGSWYTSNQTSAVNLTFDDTAGQYPTYGGSPATGSYEASDENQTASDSFISATVPSGVPQIPGTINFGYDPRSPDLRGPTTNTFENEFNGSTANGYWALYTLNAEGEPETIGGGWCIDFTLNTGTATTTTISSSQQKATAKQSVNLTATVAASPTPTSGTVTFLDNGQTPSGTSGGNNVVTVNGSGQATFPTATASYSLYNGVTNADVPIYEGDHNFTADYSGTTTGSPTYDPSNSPTFWQRFDNASTVTWGGSGSPNTYSYCNAGTILSPANETGAFFPNPSNVFVSNLPGTISNVGVTLNNLGNEAGETTTFVTQSMLEGPTGAALDFFSNTGPSTGQSLSLGNYSFADGATQVPSSPFSPGTYAPTSYGSAASTYTASPFYPVPGTIDYAAPHGTTTFSTAFGGTNGNGTWSLFMNASSLMGAALTVGNGWCMNFTETPATVTVTEGHSGTGTDGDFVPSETNAQITTVVEPTSGSTGDPTGGSNPLTLTDTLNSALTYQTFSGTGWSCSAAGQTVTCTNDSAVAQNSSYPTLTLNVNVAAGASGNLSNAATVTGAGTPASGTTGSDSIKVDVPPSLAVALTPNGAFTQGQTGQWNVVVSNTAAAGSITSGVITVSDTLPAGYSLFNYSGALWTCSGTTTAVCTTTQGISGGGSSTTLTLIVNIPATSPTSVTDSVAAFGGGDPVHTSLGNAATASDTVSVTQVPATATINGLQTQSTQTGTAFGSLAVTVKDAAGVAIPNYSSVTFTASTGTGGASGTFATSGTNTITVQANGSGVADPGLFTANASPGSFTVTTATTSGTGSATFNLTNTLPPVSQLVYGVAPLANVAQGGDTGVVTVLEENAVGVVDASGSDTITLTVTYPDTTTQIYTAGAVSGVATFDLSGVPLAQLGGYTYAASLSGVTSANATESVLVSAYTSPATSIGQLSGTQTATLVLGSSATLGSIGMLTEGGTNLDFKASTGGSCITNTAYTAGQTCTVDYTFQPTYPGFRRGAIALYDNASHVLGMVYLAGLGNGGQAIFSSNNSSSPLGSGFTFNHPFGATVDRMGDVFVSDSANNAVYEIQGPPTNTVTSLGSGFSNPEGIALDGAGNVFVADTNNNAVKEIVAAGGYTTVRTLGGGFTFTNPTGVAVDGTGNVFVADAGTNKQVEEITAASNYAAVQTLATGFQQPSGITIDGSGNLFVVDFLTTAVTELQANSSYAAQTLGSGLSGPTGIAIDAAGNLFVTNQTSSALDEILAGGGYTNVQPVGSGFDSPSGIALDAGGNVYVADTLHAAVDKLDFADAPTVSFADTAAGATSGPQTVTITNDGNQELSFSAVTYGKDFPEATGIDTDCKTSNPVASGGSCTLSIDFTPLAASATGASTPLTEGVSLSDNGPSSSLSVTVSGTETITPPVGWINGIRDATSGGTTAIGQSDNVLATGTAGDLHDGVPVQQVQILIDGTVRGNATLGLASPGLQAQHPAYANGGWSFMYSASGLTLGPHTLTAIISDSIGLTKTLGPMNFTVATSSAGPPFGWINGVKDITRGGTAVGQSDTLDATGTAADPHDGAPVQQVQIRIDGNIAGNATLGLPSPGLQSQFAIYPNGGWSFTESAAGLSLGTHTLTATISDSLGLTTTLGPTTFTVAATSVGPPFGWVLPVRDATTGGATVAEVDSLLATGVAADPHDGAPVQQVQILIDGVVTGNATLGLASPGFAAQYPAYTNGGWSFSESAASLSIGTHTLTAIASDSLGMSTTLGTVTFMVSALPSGPPVGWIDFVKDAKTGTASIAQADNLAAQGAAGDPHDGAPVMEVQILIDGSVVGNATLGLPSPGLEAAYNNPAYAHGGWSYTQASSGLSLGTHTLTAIATDSASLSTTLGTVTFTVTN